MNSDISCILENALAHAGYIILDIDSECIVCRKKDCDTDYKIKISEIVK